MKALSTDEQFKLVLGYKRFGAGSFQQILSAYQFSSSRTWQELQEYVNYNPSKFHKPSSATSAAVNKNSVTEPKDLQVSLPVVLTQTPSLSPVPLACTTPIKEEKVFASKLAATQPIFDGYVVDEICDLLHAWCTFISDLSDDEEYKSTRMCKLQTTHRITWMRTRLSMCSAILAASPAPSKSIWRVVDACLPQEARQFTPQLLHRLLPIVQQSALLNPGIASRVREQIETELENANLETELEPLLPLLTLLCKVESPALFKHECLTRAREKWILTAKHHNGPARELVTMVHETLI